MNRRNTGKNVVFDQDNCLVICTWLGSVSIPSVGNFPQDLKDAIVDLGRSLQVQCSV